ncbi:hypothetical protein ABH920_006576 [Catenulispora sp. EB89]|uniref:hypothetical protein n=1 Tax=Catenulispora sp. EB89 TaxID=3156257 RepID=UPI0035170086
MKPPIVRVLPAAVFAAACAAAMLIGLGSAAASGDMPAAAPFAHVDPSGFTLDPGQSFSQLGGLVTQLETDPRIQKVALDTLLTTTSPGRTAVWPLCHTTNLAPALNPTGFCWDTQDDTTKDWYPQGITGSGDAEPSGLVDGKRLVATSWHFAADTYARVSIADYTKPSAGVLYHHLLLVKPVLENGQVNYTNMGSVNDPGDIATHADGVMWLGDLLFVANGRQLQVYSLDHIWRMQTSGTDAGDVGLTANGAFAAWNAYALPMIGEYYTTTHSCVPAAGTTPCLNSISLAADRSSFVTSEYYNASAGGGRVIRWPLDPATGLPLTNDGTHTQATEAFRSPIWHMQGAATDGTAFYLAGFCPGATSDSPGCIHKALPDQAPHVLTEAPPLLESLSYWPKTGELWGLNEIATTAGDRVVFKIYPNS